MSKYIIELDEEYVNKRQIQLDGFVKPIEEVICDSLDFYLHEIPTDRKFIKVKVLNCFTFEWLKRIYKHGI